MSTISLGALLVAGIAVALPVSIRWNELHAAQISSTGTGGGTTAWFWGVYIIVLLWPLVGLLCLSSTLGAYPGENGPKRLVSVRGGRARWWQCVIHAFASWGLAVAGWFSAGWWGLLIAILMVAAWPLCTRTHRSFSDVLSFSALVMQVTPGAVDDSFSKARTFSGEIGVINTRARVWTAVGGYVGTLVAALVTSFVMISR